jgi:hypothetical protein
MSNEAGAQPVNKRPRRPNVASVFFAAAKAGLQVTGAVIKDGGLELKFAQGGAAASETPEDVKKLL